MCACVCMYAICMYVCMYVVCKYLRVFPCAYRECGLWAEFRNAIRKMAAVFRAEFQLNT
jgi:hypothetical protein